MVVCEQKKSQAGLQCQGCPAGGARTQSIYYNCCQTQDEEDWDKMTKTKMKMMIMMMMKIKLQWGFHQLRVNKKLRWDRCTLGNRVPDFIREENGTRWSQQSVCVCVCVASPCPPPPGWLPWQWRQCSLAKPCARNHTQSPAWDLKNTHTHKQTHTHELYIFTSAGDTWVIWVQISTLLILIRCGHDLVKVSSTISFDGLMDGTNEN